MGYHPDKAPFPMWNVGLNRIEQTGTPPFIGQKTLRDYAFVWKNCPFEAGELVQLFVISVTPRCALQIGPDRSSRPSRNGIDVPYSSDVGPGRDNGRPWPAYGIPLTVGCSLYVLTNQTGEGRADLASVSNFVPDVYPTPLLAGNKDLGVAVPWGQAFVNVGHSSTNELFTFSAEVWVQTPTKNWLLVDTIPLVTSARRTVSCMGDVERVYYRVTGIAGPGLPATTTLVVDYGQLSNSHQFPGTLVDSTSDRTIIRFAGIPFEWLASPRARLPQRES